MGCRIGLLIALLMVLLPVGFGLGTHFIKIGLGPFNHCRATGPHSTSLHLSRGIDWINRWIPTSTKLKASVSYQDEPLKEPVSSVSSYPSGCTVEFVDPETNCEVILLGCFHGSQSSATDVIKCLSQPDQHGDSSGPSNTVVALELCATRFADLRRDILRERAKEKSPSTLPSASKPWAVRFLKMVRDTAAQRGWSTGLVAGLLGGISGIQTGLSGLQPGLEFRTALTYTMDAAPTDYPSSGRGDEKIFDIVLVDQNVDETLEEIGKLPRVAMEMWGDVLFRGRSWEETFGVEASALGQAVGLRIDDTDRELVSLLGFVSRSDEAIRDMLRLLVPPTLGLLGLQALVLVTNLGLNFLQHPHQFLLDWTNSYGTSPVDQEPMISQFSIQSIMVHFSSLLLLTMTYMSLVLPAVRVVLRERDDVMARGIQSACRLATRGSNNGSQSNSLKENGGGRVVAVLGLLHVNGIAQRLLERPRHSVQDDDPDGDLD